MKNWVFIATGVLASGIRIFDLVTKVWYVVCEEFKSDLLYYTFIIALIIPVLSNKLIYIIVKANYFPVRGLYLTAYFFSDFLGLSHVFYPLLHVLAKENVQSLMVIFNLQYLSTFITCALQSTPLLIIQVFNMNSIDGWTDIKIVAISATGASFFIPIYKILMFGNEINSQIYSKKERVIINETESNSHRKDFKVIDKIEKAPEIKVLNLD